MIGVLYVIGYVTKNISFPTSPPKLTGLMIGAFLIGALFLFGFTQMIPVIDRNLNSSSSRLGNQVLQSLLVGLILVGFVMVTQACFTLGMKCGNRLYGSGGDIAGMGVWLGSIQVMFVLGLVFYGKQNPFMDWKHLVGVLSILHGAGWMIASGLSK